ncbi:hypothetical protein ACROYT_G013986 [Oculina patagonica]
MNTSRARTRKYNRFQVGAFMKLQKLKREQATILNKAVQSSGNNKEAMVSRAEMKSLLNLAESEYEKERLKYLVLRSSGMFTAKAQKIYGFHNVHKKTASVQAAYEEADTIKETIGNTWSM